jgi:phage-related protein
LRVIRNLSYKVEFYRRRDGQAPLTKFIDELSYKMRAKLFKEIDLLKLCGPELGEPYSKYLKDGFYELRCQTEGNISRIFYFLLGEKRIILTNGFIKKTQNTPQNELNLAKKYKADLLSQIKGANQNDH